MQKNKDGHSPQQPVLTHARAVTRCDNFLQTQKIKQEEMRRRIYAVNDNYFDNLDSEGPAYWLGVLSADGYVLEKANSVNLTVKESDRGWLKLYKECLGIEAPILKGSKGSIRVTFTSSKIVEALRNYGLHQKKSLTIKFCRQVPEHQVNHYIRGLLDGDGSLYQSGQTDSWVVELMGTLDVVSAVDTYLKPLLLFHRRTLPTKLISRANNFEIRYYGTTNTSNILSYVHRNSTLFLKRKRDLAEIIWKKASKIEEKFKCYGLSEDDLENLHTKLLTWKEVAQHLGVHLRNLQRYRRKLQTALKNYPRET